MNFQIQKSTERLFDKIYNGKASVLPYSMLVNLIETLCEIFNCEDLAVHPRKVDPNESGPLDHFPFVGW